MNSSLGRGGHIVIVTRTEPVCRCHVHAAPTPAAVAHAEQHTAKYMRRTMRVVLRAAVAKRKVVEQLRIYQDLFVSAAVAAEDRPACHDALLHAANIVAAAAIDNTDDAIYLESCAESDWPSAAGVCLRVARTVYRRERRFAARAVAAAAALSDLRRFAATAPLATANEILRRRLAEGGGTTL